MTDYEKQARELALDIIMPFSLNPEKLDEPGIVAATATRIATALKLAHKSGKSETL